MMTASYDLTAASRAIVHTIALMMTLVMAIARPAAAQPAFQTTAPFALLMDHDTGAVLFEKEGDTLMTPASMAKVMTAAVVFEEIRAGRLKLDDQFVVSENAWRRGGAPSGGSTMFAALNSRIAIADLISGLIVHSGNDAAIALAEGISGTEANFAALMTRRSRELGLAKSEWRNASGAGHPEQKTTSRELALLTRHLIRTYPDLYPYFAGREFTWNKIRQLNRNPLLAMDIGADGLKTGNLTESGFGLVGSATRDGRRLIVVLNGLPTAQARAQEARKLLDYGFRSFEYWPLFAEGQRIGEAKVYGGETPATPLRAAGPVTALIPRGSTERLTVRIVYHGPLRPPVISGQRVATLRVSRGAVVILEEPLFAAQDVGEGDLSRKAADALSEGLGGWVRRQMSRLLKS